MTTGFLPQLSARARRLLRHLFSVGSARAFACIGRRLADRTKQAEAGEKIKWSRCAKRVFGGAPNPTREGACSPQNIPNTCLLLPASVTVLLMLLAVNAGGAGPVELSRQTITLPANAGAPLFVDIDGNGRFDLLVIDPVEKKLWRWRQRPDGFRNSPDQAIALPPQTAWVALCDVEAHPGLELLFSTASGLVYSRQNAGLFESERRPLIAARQPFTNFDFPILTSLTTNKTGTDVMIPVISAGQTVLYRRNSAYEWSPGPPMTLDVKQTAWSDSRDPRIYRDRWINRDPWMMGPHPAYSLRVEQSFLAEADARRDPEPENQAIKKIIDDMKRNAPANPHFLERLDVDGDGREDLVLWQASGKLDVKTDLYLFLRGADQKLPERPTQILHCRGYPIPVGSTEKVSPLGHLKGDGVCQLVLLELKSTVITTGGLVDTLLSHGVDWSLTIRSFHDGAFSRSPDASLPVTTVLPAEALRDWAIFILGDFNGDGRPDLLVRRSDTQWNIFFSTSDGRWFAPQPALTFAAPVQGYIEINDLNGDGLSDIIWHELDQPSLSIFMSPFRRATDKNP
jgi:hypothetical protein